MGEEKGKKEFKMQNANQCRLVKKMQVTNLATNARILNNIQFLYNFHKCANEFALSWKFIIVTV
jgi:hypothetical protein